uniref:Uncharacterized protein n=1 Tax=Elaeophora elaphi TaxID=1147741 RepID=A0A0R3RQC6_9BILA
MAQTQSNGINSATYFALCVGLFVLTTSCTNANVINEEDNGFNDGNTKTWYALLLRSKPQFGFERGSRSHGKPTFLRFGKRDFDAYNPDPFKNK